MGKEIEYLLSKFRIFIQSRKSDEARHSLFHEIWRQYHKRLLFFIRHMVREDSEDLLQEIMLKVFQNIEHYNPFYSFNTWIYTIAKNHCINFVKKRKLATRPLTHEPTIDQSLFVNHSPEQEMICRELFDRIDGFFSQLEPTYQQMAFLRFYEGMKIRTIARLLNIPEGTVKSRLYLIKKDLGALLEVHDEN